MPSSKSDIVERLREAANWPREDGLDKLCQEAANEIEFLRKRAGAVSEGEDTAAIKDRVHPGRKRPA